MIKLLHHKLIIVISLSLSLCADDHLFDQSLENMLSMKTELKAEVGSRGNSRNFLNSSSPVDVVTYEQIDKTGLTSLSDVLRYFVPGFNAPETSISDGSDHIRAFTLRGMSPDQVLVLINGKRLHMSALLHVNATIGRGSSNVNLDTITLKSIEKIEILRDGAAAQYGSDAISGVINIILKGIGHKNSVSLHSGQKIKGDGLIVNVEAFVSTPLKYDGFINLSIQAKEQQKTNRAGTDDRVTPPSVNTHVGIPDAKSISAMLNVDLPQSDYTNLYATALFGYSDSKASAFHRYDEDVTKYPAVASAVYPDGFLPIINAKILDFSATTGISGEFLDGIIWNLSNTFGHNNIDYYVEDSMNYSLGITSPTSFDNGGMSISQNTTSLDLKKDMNLFYLSAGLEHRHERYKLNSGNLASYAGSSSQGFAGYRVENEADDDRNSYSIYLDVMYTLSNDISLEWAARYEDFSDFGSTINTKLALSYKLNSQTLIRSSASTGFRAPSLAQSNYSHTSTFGGLIEGTFTPEHEVSKIFGAKELAPENSKHLTIGSVYALNKETFIMLDYFYTKVHDKIMLSNEFDSIGATAEQIAALTLYGVSKARFFTNSVNTETQGIDIKFNHQHTYDNNSKIDFNIWYNYSQNKVIEYNDTTTKENSYEQIDRIENGQPKSSLRILSTYDVNKFSTTLNISNYGSYKQVIDDKSYKFDSAWTTDLDVEYKATDKLIFAIGGINILDTIPNKWDGLSGTYYGYNGIKPYSRYSPFGYSGAYYYLRVSLEF